MAEAIVDTPTTNQKFFCYNCNKEVGQALDDFSCPICKGGWIEEIQDGVDIVPSPTTRRSSSSQASRGSSFDVGGLDFLQNPSAVSGFLSHFLAGLSNDGGRTVDGRGGGGSQSATIRFGTPQNFRRTVSDGSTPSGATHNASPNQFFVFDPRGGAVAGTNIPHDNPIEQVLFTFLNDLVQGLHGGGGGGAPILANLGDYAWGRDGLDTIVTQLMNQMEGSGPPPLATDRIDNLPDVVITAEQVERKLQCSVCWDDFRLEESVKKLECDHIYHPDCIIPWLKLHGTCPICRKDLTGQLKEDPNAQPSTRFESDNSSSTTDERNRTLRSPSSQNPTTSNPLNLSFMDLLQPILGTPTGPRSNSSPNQGNSRRQQGQDQDPNLPPNFDNMDMEFD